MSSITAFHLIVGYLLINFQIFIHEHGHAKRFLEAGHIPRRLQVGLPIPLPYLKRIRFVFRSKRFLSGTPLVFYPLPLAGYVQLNSLGEQTFQKKSYAEQANVFMAGIWANLFYSWVGLTLLILPRVTWKGFLINTMIILTLLAGRKLLLVYVLPILSLLLGIALMPYLIKVVFFTAVTTESSMIEITHQAVINGTNLWTVFLVCVVAGLALAIMNLLPIFPFDGGHVIYKAISDKSLKAAKAFQIVGIVLSASMVVKSILMEVLAIFKLFK